MCLMALAAGHKLHTLAHHLRPPGGPKVCMAFGNLDVAGLILFGVSANVFAGFVFFFWSVSQTLVPEIDSV